MDEVVLSGDLAQFLRARRQNLAPEQAGIDAGGDRRVTGLRREEVARRAGVSEDYYRRLEQGRERHPSHQVLTALSRALQLDAHATRHLFEIVAPAWHEEASPPDVSDGVRLMLDHSIIAPAMVVGPASDILALNAQAAALYSAFARVDNLAMMVFLDSAASEFYDDWDAVARASVANLRAASTQFPREPRVGEVIGELSMESTRFASLWAEHEVRPRIEAQELFHHPLAGELHLQFDALAISGVPGQRVYVYTPIPDLPGTRAFRALLEDGGCPPPGADAGLTDVLSTALSSPG
ncbi:helix-turn-helix transcriptional regulator [Microbacterium sp. RD1]|uniref:helix-turn-helix transcriptional regulator n=1 Tax=Microbacterium sp. RD1 TaxID=3457313 RepID=UPI003FA54217